jgi:hypothetical protein
MTLMHELFPLRLEKHKDVVCAVNVTRDLLTFVMAYRTELGLGISALFAVDADAESTPLRELPDYDKLVAGETRQENGYLITKDQIIREMKTRGMGDDAKMRLRNNLIAQHLMMRAETDRFLAIAINSPAVKKTPILPFVFSVTEKEYRDQQSIRKGEQERARRCSEPVPLDLPAPDVLRDAVWYEKQKALLNRLSAEKAFSSQKNIEYRNRILAWMLENWQLENGGRVDGIHALFSVLELAEKFGLTKKTLAQTDNEYMERLQDRSGFKILNSARII